MGIIIGIRAGIGGGKRKPDKWLDPVSAEFTRRTSGGSLSVGSRAKIGSVKGRTLVWNQMVKNGDFGTGNTNGWSLSGSLTAVVNNGVCELTKDSSSSAYLSQVISLTGGHKYFVSFDLKAYNNKVFFLVRDTTADQSYANTKISSDFDKFHHIQTTFVAVADKYNAQIRVGDSNTSDWQTYYVKNVMIIDLTLLGLDSLSADEFAKLFPAEYYPSTYTGNNYATFSPYLVNNIASAIKTTGFNQWDEQWEAGGIYQDNGRPSPTSGYYRSKGFVGVLPDTRYYIKCPVAMFILYYDKDYNYLGLGFATQNIKNNVFTTPRGAAYLRFRNQMQNTWTPYNNDICINFSCPRNGEYQRYWENSLALNLTTITGKAGGDSVVIFPDGMKSVGNIYDELTKTTATKRIGSQVVSGSAGDAITLVGCDTTALSYVCATNIGTLSGGVLTLSADVSEVAVYFALATPEVYTLDSPLSLSYRVDSFGTEERLPADTPSELSAPIRIEVSYTEPKQKDIKPVLSGPLLGAGGDNNETQYETDS